MIIQNASCKNMGQVTANHNRNNIRESTHKTTALCPVTTATRIHSLSKAYETVNGSVTTPTCYVT